MHDGQKVKVLMKRKGLRNVDVAKACKITAGAVSNWFSSGKIDKKNLSVVAEMIGISSDQIIKCDPDELIDQNGQLVAQRAMISAHLAEASVRSLSPGALELAWHFDNLSSREAREEVLLLVLRLATRPPGVSARA